MGAACHRLALQSCALAAWQEGRVLGRGWGWGAAGQQGTALEGRIGPDWGSSAGAVTGRSFDSGAAGAEASTCVARRLKGHAESQSRPPGPAGSESEVP